MSGHTHDAWVVPVCRERPKADGSVAIDEQVHIKTATYKDEYQDGTEGWHIERGGPPKPLGDTGSASTQDRKTTSDLKSSEQIDLEKYVARLATDFPFFLEQLWAAVNLPPLAPHQKQIASWLEKGPRRRGVRAFRGAAKTWCTIGYCLWRLFKDPNQRILLVSKSEKHSKDSLYMARKWIGQVPFLQHMVPDRLEGQRTVR